MTLRISFTQEQAIQVFELVFALVGILFFTQSLLVPLGGLNTLVRYGLFLTGVGLLTLRWRMVVYALKGDPFLLIVNILSFISFSWSEVPGDSQTAVREILYMVTFGLYLATRYTLREQLILLCWGMELAALISAFYAITSPAIGTHMGDKFAGAWKGVYSQKNILSSMMTLSIAAHLVLMFDKTFNRLWSVGGLGFTLFVILMTTSKSGLVIFIVLLTALFTFRTIRWRNLAMVMIFATLIGTSVPFGVVFFGNWDSIMIGLGRDPTLTGRTDIWGYAFTRIAERPLFGYGRVGFWNPALKYPSEAGLAVVGSGPVNLLSGTYSPPHSHNGAVDTLLEIGIVGFVLLLISLTLFIIRTVKRVYLTDTPEDFWPLIFLTFFLMYNITESLILLGENIFWVYYIALAYGVRLGQQEEKIDHPPIRYPPLEKVVPLAARQRS